MESDTIYNTSDLNLLSRNITYINNQIKLIKSKSYKPHIDDKKKIQQIIIDFIKEKKRKIYGGYALDKLSISKGYDSFYNEYDIPDIDFYSIDPNSDIIELCNKFHELGHKVQSREAKHQNTYSIFVEYDLYCDVTYAPKCIYNAIPTIKIDDINYVNPNFMIIDYLKIITDPLSSYWRLEKSFERLLYMEEIFKLPRFMKSIDVNSDDSIKKCINIILNELKTMDDTIIIGFYAYLYYLKYSNLAKKNKNLAKFSHKNYDEIPFIEIITKNFKDYSLKIINKLKETTDINYTEYYPFFTFTGYSVEIYFNNTLICIIYDHNKRTLPYINANGFKIGSFSQTLMHAQINVIKYKTQKEEELKYIYMLMVSHLLQMKKYYFEENKKNIMDNTPFKEFVLDIIVPTDNPDNESHMKYERRKAKNKAGIYIYDPSKIKKEEKIENFFFPNISGNKIINVKWQKLTDNKESLDENDNNDTNDNSEEIEEKTDE